MLPIVRIKDEFRKAFKLIESKQTFKNLISICLISLH
jgi:hypothetical protein